MEARGGSFGFDFELFIRRGGKMMDILTDLVKDRPRWN
jgi:hypothetical protein